MTPAGKQMTIMTTPPRPPRPADAAPLSKPKSKPKPEDVRARLLEMIRRNELLRRENLR